MPAPRRVRRLEAAGNDRPSGRRRVAALVAAILVAAGGLFGPGIAPIGEPPVPVVAKGPDGAGASSATPRRLPGVRPIDAVDDVPGRGGRSPQQAPSTSGGGNVVAPAPAATATPAPAPAAPARTTPEADRAARFQAALDNARITSKAYGLSFAAVRHGRVVWSGASGTLPDGRTPLGADTPLVIGSLTKTFVAAAVLQLVEEGRVQLDDEIAALLPDLRLPKNVTVRQLLSHTSGLADLFNARTIEALEKAPAKAWTAEQVLEALAEPWFAPGKDWAYANTNYLVLALLVERLTDAPLSAELERRFLTPLALSTIDVVDPTVETAALMPAWASIFFGSGAMVGGARDVARWGDALYGSRILDADTVAEMERVNKKEYGLGTQRFKLGKRVGYGHSGLLSHYTALVIHLPKEHLTLAVLVNRSHADVTGLLGLRPGKGQSLLELALSAE